MTTHSHKDRLAHYVKVLDDADHPERSDALENPNWRFASLSDEICAELLNDSTAVVTNYAVDPHAFWMLEVVGGPQHAQLHVTKHTHRGNVTIATLPFFPARTEGIDLALGAIFRESVAPPTTGPIPTRRSLFDELAKKAAPGATEPRYSFPLGKVAPPARAFSLAAVLSLTTGVAVRDGLMDELRKLSAFITGNPENELTDAAMSFFNEHITNAARTRWPDLPTEAPEKDKPALAAWLAVQEARFGAVIDVDY